MSAESRAFAAMVQSSSGLNRKSSLSSLSSTSSSTAIQPRSAVAVEASSSDSPFTLQQLLSYLPFLSSSPSSSLSSPTGSAQQQQQFKSHHSSDRASCATQTCRSYCCTTSRLDHPLNKSSLASTCSSLPTSSTLPAGSFYLRPKNYYSKRQKFISSLTIQQQQQQQQKQHDLSTSPTASLFYSSSSSSSSNSNSPTFSDCGSDSGKEDSSELTMTSIDDHLDRALTRDQQQLHRRAVQETATRIETSGVESDTSSSSSSSSATRQSPQHQKSQGTGSRIATDGPYLFVFDLTLSLYYPIRAMILFILGFVFSLIIDHLQTQHHLVEYPGTMPRLWDTASWLPPTCGASAVLIGTIYPLGDYLWWGRQVRRSTSRDWSSVMRCLGGFIGVNYAASKLPWTSSLQVSCTLALISVALWFLFDRTFHGFMISLTVASFGTTVAYFLVLNGWYSFTRADFFGVGSWIPCILYSSSVCFGSIGRQLDVVPEAWYHQSSTNNTHLKSE
ncbi:hypothetical protein EMPS_08148 [Entomortierella parvispora]|uniref:INSIG-domain-containing protein n=1 Tax=Entomortierella parvispora TaxID=205924 RepID=A0A9P3LZC2_9FUNG|nr:hypothetical protein EMPS_08148 [Entomortierella parvispora]